MRETRFWRTCLKAIFWLSLISFVGLFFMEELEAGQRRSTINFEQSHDTALATRLSTRMDAMRIEYAHSRITSVLCLTIAAVGLAVAPRPEK
jgi:hypothetical protein